MKYLPEGYENLKTESNYLKMSQMQEGENRLRIVQRPIAGWIDWKDNKPYRYRPDKKPSSSFDLEKPIRPFWACHVWDYEREGLFVLEITQSSILKALTQYGQDEEWGDFTDYDIKIIKEGNGKETRYHVLPTPPQPLAESIQEIIRNSPVNLEALYSGGDPWGKFEGNLEREAPKNSIDTQQVQILEEKLEQFPELASKVTTFMSSHRYDSFHSLPQPTFDKLMTNITRLEEEQHDKEVVAF